MSICGFSPCSYLPNEPGMLRRSPFAENWGPLPPGHKFSACRSIEDHARAVWAAGLPTAWHLSWPKQPQTFWGRQCWPFASDKSFSWSQVFLLTGKNLWQEMIQNGCISVASFWGFGKRPNTIWLCDSSGWEVKFGHWTNLIASNPLVSSIAWSFRQFRWLRWAFHYSWPSQIEISMYYNYIIYLHKIFQFYDHSGQLLLLIVLSCRFYLDKKAWTANSWEMIICSSCTPLGRRHGSFDMYIDVCVRLGSDKPFVFFAYKEQCSMQVISNCTTYADSQYTLLADVFEHSAEAGWESFAPLIWGGFATQSKELLQFSILNASKGAF